MGKENKRITLGSVLGVVFYLIIFLIVFFIVKSMDKYTEGKTPTIDENKYVVKIKEDVFRTAFKNNSWIDIVDKRSSKKKLEFRIAFDENMLKDVMATTETFTYFTWDTIVEDGVKSIYFSLPIETRERESFDYVTIPTWFLTELIDSEILDVEEKSIETRLFWDWFRFRNKQGE